MIKTLESSTFTVSDTGDVLVENPESGFGGALSFGDTGNLPPLKSNKGVTMETSFYSSAEEDIIVIEPPTGELTPITVSEVKQLPREVIYQSNLNLATGLQEIRRIARDIAENRGYQDSPFRFTQVDLGSGVDSVEDGYKLTSSSPLEGNIFVEHCPAHQVRYGLGDDEVEYKPAKVIERIRFMRREGSDRIMTTLLVVESDKQGNPMSMKLIEEAMDHSMARHIEVASNAQVVTAEQIEVNRGSGITHELSLAETEYIVGEIKSVLTGDVFEPHRDTRLAMYRKKMKKHIASVVLLGFSVGGSGVAVAAGHHFTH